LGEVWAGHKSSISGLILALDNDAGQDIILGFDEFYAHSYSLFLPGMGLMIGSDFKQ
jgi:hypothetical protein